MIHQRGFSGNSVAAKGLRMRECMILGIMGWLLGMPRRNVSYETVYVINDEANGCSKEVKGSDNQTPALEE